MKKKKENVFIINEFHNKIVKSQDFIILVFVTNLNYHVWPWFMYMIFLVRVLKYLGIIII